MRRARSALSALRAAAHQHELCASPSSAVSCRLAHSPSLLSPASQHLRPACLLLSRALARPRVEQPQAAAPHAPPDSRLATHSAAADLLQLSERDELSFLTFSAEAEARLLPEGCPALSAELAASGTRSLLVRPCFLRARALLLPAAAAAAPRPPLVLDGQSGAGKSVLLAQLVACWRLAGGLALYVPSGHSLTVDSNFYRNEPAEPAAWDTPEHAAALLRSLDAAHGAELGRLRQRRPGCADAPLRSLVEAGTAAAATPAQAVDSFLALFDELALVAETPVLVAVDELNALSGWSEYHQVTGPRSNKRLCAAQLRVAAAVRDFQRPMAGQGMRLGATSATVGVSPKVHLADCPAAARRAVPRLSREEATAVLALHVDAGAAALPGAVEGGAAAALEAVAGRLHAITVGNGREQRVTMPLLL